MRPSLRRAGVGAAVVVAVAAAVVALRPSGPGSSDRPASTRRSVATVASTIASVPATVTTTTSPPTTVPPTSTTDAGSEPQTATLPTSTSAQFQAAMAALWQGVVSGSAIAARPAFFPEGAYLQLKDIADPASDYTGRLLADFAADVGAAHSLLGPGAGTAALVAVEVPEQYGHWVPPGVCDNRVGYYEVANSRVVYELAGQTRSFGIASLISWRGEWYVVHLGAILRSSSAGTVEDPEIGPGTSPDSSTC